MKVLNHPVKQGTPTILLILLLFFSSCEEKKKRIETNSTKYEVPFKKHGELTFISNQGDTIRNMNLEIADTPEKRTQGLMYRSRMNDQQAMLFVFEEEEPQSFWMKNTYISLDIIFADSAGTIVTIQKNTIPYSEDPVMSYQPALYVIEVVAGFCDLYDLKKGDRFTYRKD